MCTLSWQQHANRLDILFNRDEMLARPEARPPGFDCVEGVEVLAPLDPQGGGTWLASNEYGVTICLLNNYQHRTSAVSTSWRSRGLLARDLVALVSLGLVDEKLRSLALTDYRPFVVVAFAGTCSIAQWLWDGRTLLEINQPSSPVTTSSLFPVLIPGLRRWLFRRATGNGTRLLSLEEQMSLHSNRRPWPAAFAVAMSRRDRATRSLTHVRVTPVAVSMNYWAGDPAGDARQAPSRSLRLIGARPVADAPTPMRQSTR